MDFLRLKDSLFASSTTNIEKVEVNQRHLIDKILARYSAEFTVYRELIQNANDAGATEVQVEFKTGVNSKGVTIISSIVVRNNGRAFSEDDWRRLKKIAEGNPDEQKIGFFGVGFYSLFSICEEPLVISGSKCLGFYWTGDQLYTKSADYSADNSNNWTSICLDLREPLELPDFDEFGQFLCKSLLFTYSLSSASFIVNDKLQLQCKKVLSPPSSFPVSKYKTASGLFNLSSFEGRFVQMSIEKNYQSKEPEMETNSASSVFSGLWRLAQSKFTEKGKEEAAIDSKLRQPGTFHVFLKHFRASASVKTSSKFADEMERTTKKKPFQNVNIDLIYVNWEQINASNCDFLDGVKVSTKHPILSQLLPCPCNGKVFIGFETHQTTGLGIHLTAPFIPTVERESIDFVDGCLKIWNLELLQLGGRLCRIIYEEEVKYINFEDSPSYLKKSKHLMETFNFKPSTPSARIGGVLLDEFLRYSNDIKLPSSTGFVSAVLLRHVPEEMLTFVRNTPRIPDEIATVCQEMLQKLAISRQSNRVALIHTVSVSDIIEFELKPKKEFDEKQTVACLKWWLKQLASPFAASKGNLNQSIVDDFSSALLVPSAQESNALIPLKNVSFYACDQLSGLYFSEKAKIKFFPIDCLSPAFSSKFDQSDLSILLRIQELNIADWLDCIVKWTYAKDLIEGDFELSEQLLMFISKNFDSPPRSVDLELFQGRLCNSLSTLKCIPVGKGVLKRPKECYFEDVPRVQVSMNLLNFSTETRRSRVNENMLKGAGVLSHLPLDQIFANIDSLNWDHVGLIKYLVRVQNELSKADMNKLKLASLFPDTLGTGSYKLSELYTDSINSELSSLLNLKILKWTPSIPKEGTEIGEFLSDLGFNYIVPWRALLKGVSGAEPSKRAAIFRYFFENFSYYQDYDGGKVDFPFVPVESVDGADRSVFLPNQVFLDETLNHLGFYLLHLELKKFSQLLGIRERPASEIIVRQVVTCKLSVKVAEEVFAYCARISDEFSKEDWRQFRQSAFIPCIPSGTGDVVYKLFDQVFLPSSSSSSSPFADLFDQIDFGAQANSFLRSVGVCEEPRCEDLINLLLKDASGVLSNLKDAKYVDLLERVSSQWLNLSSKNPKLAKSFVSSKSFIGLVKSTGESEEKIQCSLYGLNEVFLIDDVISHQLFNLPSVPGSLETFYLKLGCRWVSSVIKSEWKWTGKPRVEGSLVKLTRDLLTERLGLILSSIEGGGSSSASSSEGGKIAKGGRKRLSNVKLFEVDSIEICRTCNVGNGTSTNSQSSCAFTDAAVSHASIYLSRNAEGQFDHFDLASVIVGLLCEKRGRLQDSLLVASLLTTPLSSLRAKGFQVETLDKAAAEIDVDLDRLEKMKLTEERREQKPASEQLKASTQSTRSTQNIQSTEGAQIQSTQSIQDAQTQSTNSVQSTQDTQSTKSNSSNPVPAPSQQSPKWRDSLMGFFKKATSSSSSLQQTKHQETTAKNGRNEETLRRVLDRGIKSLKSHSSGDFDTKTHNDNLPGPERNEKIHQDDYCQTVTSLKLIGSIGVGGYCDVYRKDNDDIDGFLMRNNDSLMMFYELICGELAEGIFKIPKKTKSVHMFHDPESSSIAFNRGNILFFNLAYFQGSEHENKLKLGGEEALRCRSFWFMTFCHELAHNFVHDHNVQHEFYMSSFAETYMIEFIRRCS